MHAHVRLVLVAEQGETLKLYNRTTLSDGVVRAVLTKAGRAVGARTSRVVVEVNQGRTFTCSGIAYQGARVKIPVRRGKWRWIDTAGGCFQITMPAVRLNLDGKGAGDPLEMAEIFFKTARHEWAHIEEFQRGGRWTLTCSTKNPGGRRPEWRDRPEEQRAIAACEDADALGRTVEWASGEILALAQALRVKARTVLRRRQ